MPGPLTKLLAEITAGRADAENELLPLVYAELRKIARARMAGERQVLTLQPTALVHEAYLRLLGDANLGWQSRSHFYGAAAEAMRRILIERARKRSREKHGGKLKRTDLDDARSASQPRPDEILALDQALSRLEAKDSEMAAVVKLRFFAGLSIPETAQVLETSERTINRLWTGARAWLAVQLSRRDEQPTWL